MDKTKSIFRRSSLCFIIGMVSSSHAAEFFTIIGPDGRPMIVQQPESKKVQSIQKKAAIYPSTSVQSKQNEIEGSALKGSPTVAKNAETQFNEAQSKANQSKQAQSKNIQSEVSSSKQPLSPEVELSDTPSKVSSSALNESKRGVSQPISDAEKNPEQPKKLNQAVGSNVAVNNALTSPKETKLKATDTQTAQAEVLSDKGRQIEPLENKKLAQLKPEQAQNQDTQKDDSNQMISELDGVQYVDNEYLEYREFNLEGKKRFYIMPDSSVGGTRRFETIEREKGITKSVFSKFIKNTPEDLKPVALASTYYRLPKNEVEQSLEQACFTGKKIEKAKLLSLDKNEIGLWPVPPIKEKFVYDVLKIDTPVQNIHLTSYASSQKSPSFYWPLVVFLDQQGCVIEGVSGFKNQDVESNHLQYSAMEGVLKKPPNAIYLFMTPLAEAVDAQNVKLSNKGQIKLTVLR